MTGQPPMRAPAKTMFESTRTAVRTALPIMDRVIETGVPAGSLGHRDLRLWIAALRRSYPG
jgi:hypothetical protein